jgi:hypothetical protein
MVPLGNTVAPISSKVAGGASSPKSRLPAPTTTGKVISRSSSTRSSRRSVRMSSPLPCTWISSPSSSLSARTAAGTSSITVVPSHPADRRVREATYFGTRAKAAPIGSSGPVSGQWDAKIS